MMSSMGMNDEDQGGKGWDMSKDPWELGHTEMLVHAKVVDLYRREFQGEQKGKIGITLVSLGGNGKYGG